jgi:hypothetical protein
VANYKSKTAILSVIAVLAAAAVIGTLASPAFANSGFTVIQKNDQDQKLRGFAVFGSQFASNCIAVGNTGCNACRIG